MLASTINTWKCTVAHSQCMLSMYFDNGLTPYTNAIQATSSATAFVFCCNALILAALHSSWLVMCRQALKAAFSKLPNIIKHLLNILTCPVPPLLSWSNLHAYQCLTPTLRLMQQSAMLVRHRCWNISRNGPHMLRASTCIQIRHKSCGHGTVDKEVLGSPCMHTNTGGRRLCPGNSAHAAPIMRALPSSRRPTQQRIIIKALSTAQELLQDQIRKAQSSSQVLRLVADQRPLLDSTLASTAVQKLAYLPRAYPDTNALEVTLAELAHAARRNMTELKNPIDMLAGFAELDFKCKAIGQLLETYVVHYDMSQHQAVDKNTDAPVVQRQWDTVSWGWADNSDMACKNLVTVAWAFGRLLQQCDDDMLRFIDSIAAELSKKLHNNLLKDAFTPDDLADTVDAFANVHDTCRESNQPLGNTSSVPTRYFTALAQAMLVTSNLCLRQLNSKAAGAAYVHCR